MQRLVLAAAAPPVTVRRAETPAELRAAGYLRAAAFTVVPPDRSEFARQARIPCMGCEALKPWPQGCCA